jgi:hypothetical protein
MSLLGHLQHLDEGRTLNESELKQQFADDLQIYIRLVPLIQAGIVSGASAPSMKVAMNNSGPSLQLRDTPALRGYIANRY